MAERDWHWWLTGHHLERRATHLAGLVTLAAVLELAAATGVAYLAGFSAVGRALGRFDWPWLVAALAVFSVSFVGYYFAYRGIYRVENGPTLSRRQMTAVVIAGFGGFLAQGGAALDTYALRAAGADEREATVRVSTLAGLEHGVLGLLGCAAAIVVLGMGLPHPATDFSIPWAVLPVPGFLVAFWAAERYRERFEERPGWRGKVGVFLDTIHLARKLFLQPGEHGPAVLGMAVFWVAEAFAMWAALAAFGLDMNGAALFVGFATGLAFTRRTGPLAGAGILMLVLPLTIWYSGAPLALAVLGVFVYRVLALWVPMPLAFRELPTLRAMGRGQTPYTEGTSKKRQEPALQPE